MGEYTGGEYLGGLITRMSTILPIKVRTRTFMDMVMVTCDGDLKAWTSINDQSANSSACQISCRKVMFSLACLFTLGGGACLVPGPFQRWIMSMGVKATVSMGLGVGIHIHPPTTLVYKLLDIPTTIRTVGKWAVRILLECFLVVLLFAQGYTVVVYLI